MPGLVRCHSDVVKGPRPGSIFLREMLCFSLVSSKRTDVNFVMQNLSSPLYITWNVLKEPSPPVVQELPTFNSVEGSSSPRPLTEAVRRAL